MVLPPGNLYTSGQHNHPRRGGKAMLDIAVLGAGRIGRIHAANVAACPEARLVGIADIDATVAGRLANALDTRPIGVEEAMRADAVLIASPTPTHADYIERAATAGHAVFCEKP